VGPREKNRAAPSAIFFPKTEKRSGLKAARNGLGGTEPGFSHNRISALAQFTDTRWPAFLTDFGCCALVGSC
jgi:hypothetical protein